MFKNLISVICWWQNILFSVFNFSLFYTISSFVWTACHCCNMSPLCHISSKDVVNECCTRSEIWYRRYTGGRRAGDWTRGNPAPAHAENGKERWGRVHLILMFWCKTSLKLRIWSNFLLKIPTARVIVTFMRAKC